MSRCWKWGPDKLKGKVRSAKLKAVNVPFVTVALEIEATLCDPAENWATVERVRLNPGGSVFGPVDQSRLRWSPPLGLRINGGETKCFTTDCDIELAEGVGAEQLGQVGDDIAAALQGANVRLFVKVDGDEVCGGL